ncbi:class I SAM-dependent methyltransferase [Pseudonocardia xishanensis]|uniref:Class I SAM-dependent methyltransferase n=1 Tax=Pseudonocardia xishanensis TaxID=630995 RepID=A0ABP8RCY2_9PSEU
MPPRRLVFGSAADDYARHRPDYPAAPVEWALEHTPGPRVLDLAAGTGKLTARLLERDVVAVDPDPGMLARLRADLPQVEALEGSAEDIPLPTASVDAVLVGQAIHWFDPERAWPEIARVLRPGGVFAGLWNCDDGAVDWVTGYASALAHGMANPRGGDGAELDLPEPFGPTERATFRNDRLTTTDDLVASVRTQSWALASSEEDREAALARMRDYLATRPETASGSFVLPGFTLVLRTLRS